MDQTTRGGRSTRRLRGENHLQPCRAIDVADSRDDVAPLARQRKGHVRRPRRWHALKPLVGMLREHRRSKRAEGLAPLDETVELVDGGGVARVGYNRSATERSRPILGAT